MKTTSRHTIITALAAAAMLMTATAAALGAQETGSRYEGSVYVSYFYETTGGLLTVHGARLAGDRWFLGAAASWDLGENGSFLQADLRRSRHSWDAVWERRTSGDGFWAARTAAGDPAMTLVCCWRLSSGSA